MNGDREELHETVRYLEWIASQALGNYFLLTQALSCYRLQLAENQAKRISMLELVDPDIATTEYLDTLDMLMGEGPPGHPETEILYRANEGDVKTWFDPGGSMYRFVGNMIVVLLYQYWESYFRPRIAAILNEKPSDVKVPVMGDLRHIRNSIIHHSSIANADIERCEILKWFAPGDEISIDYVKVKRIRELIHEFCNDPLGN